LCKKEVSPTARWSVLGFLTPDPMLSTPATENGVPPMKPARFSPDPLHDFRDLQAGQRGVRPQAAHEMAVTPGAIL
jgi:hypothetical protein